MGFFKNLFGGSPAKSEGKYYLFEVKCKRCGEVIPGRIDMNNDLSQTDDGDGYVVRKTLIGSNRCFQQIAVKMTFDTSRQLIERDISGGEFVNQ